MTRFTDDELTLITLYDPGTRKGAIYELQAVLNCLLPDETELEEMTVSTLTKLKAMTDEEFDQITHDLILQMPLAPFTNPHRRERIPIGWYEGPGPDDEPDS